MKTFIFDFDSTIFPGETLDEIMQHSIQGADDYEEKSQEITDICHLGMSGAISMAESLKRRLAIASPTEQNIKDFVSENSSRIDERLRNLLIDLQKNGHGVYVVSGGFEEWIKPLLEGIVAKENIHANQISNHQLPMTFDNIIRRDKEELIEGILNGSSINDAEISIIGDGATDYSVYENGIAQQFMGTFFYTDISDRASIVHKAKENNQPIFSTLEQFISHMNSFL